MTSEFCSSVLDAFVSSVCEGHIYGINVLLRHTLVQKHAGPWSECTTTQLKGNSLNHVEPKIVYTFVCMANA